MADEVEIEIVPGLEADDAFTISLSFGWRHSGAIVAGDTGPVVQSEVVDEPGVYRIRILREGNAWRGYVGETKHLASRFDQHAKSQEPIGHWIRGALAHEGAVELDVMVMMEAGLPGGTSPQLPVQRKLIRHAVEGAAVLREIDRDEDWLINHEKIVDDVIPRKARHRGPWWPGAPDAIAKSPKYLDDGKPNLELEIDPT